MQFSRPMAEGRLIKRYKRFLADVQLAHGAELTVHCANSGSMATCASPHSRVLVSDSGNPARKLRYTWELIEVANTWVGVNTAVPNAAVAHFIAAQQVPELRDYASLRREVRYGQTQQSRIDILLESPNRPSCYVEVKNCTMRLGQHVAFPDAVTTRGQKHLLELIHAVTQGHRAVMFYYVGRSDAERWRPADEIDPLYGSLLRQAIASGVEALAYRVEYTPQGVHLQKRIPIDL